MFVETDAVVLMNLSCYLDLFTWYLVVLVEIDAVVLLHLPCFLYLFTLYLVVFVEIDAVVLLHLSCYLDLFTWYLVVLVEIDAVVLLHLSCFLNLHPALLGGFLEDVQLLLDLQKGCQQAVHYTVYTMLYCTLYSVQVSHIVMTEFFQHIK